MRVTSINSDSSSVSSIMSVFFSLASKAAQIRRFIMFFLVLLNCWATITTAFIAMVPTATAASSSTTTTTTQTSAATESLTFQADCTLLSDPFPSPLHRINPQQEEAHENWNRFFGQESTRNLFLSAGGKCPCQKVSPTPQLQALLHEACQHHQYGPTWDIQSNNDIIQCIDFMETTTKANFPGFTIKTKVLNGCQTFHEAGCLPVYEFCMLGDSKSLSGSPPVVWLVNKLTGIPSSNNKSKRSTSTGSTTSTEFTLSETRAISRVSLENIDDAEQQEKMAVVQVKVQFTTCVQFPKLLLKLLPASKAKVEERGTQSVRNVLVKDTNEALRAVRKAWLHYHDQKNQKEVEVEDDDQKKDGLSSTASSSQQQSNRNDC